MLWKKYFEISKTIKTWKLVWPWFVRIGSNQNNVWSEKTVSQKTEYFEEEKTSNADVDDHTKDNDVTKHFNGRLLLVTTV